MGGILDFLIGSESEKWNVNTEENKNQSFLFLSIFYKKNEEYFPFNSMKGDSLSVRYIFSKEKMYSLTFDFSAALLVIRCRNWICLQEFYSFFFPKTQPDEWFS